MTTFDEQAWRRAKRANRARRRRQRVYPVPDTLMGDWLAAVERDGLAPDAALHELVHRCQDAMIAQNARRIRELEAERGRMKEQAA